MKSQIFITKLVAKMKFLFANIVKTVSFIETCEIFIGVEPLKPMNKYIQGCMYYWLEKEILGTMIGSLHYKFKERQG